MLWAASRPPLQGLRVALPARRLRAKAFSCPSPLTPEMTKRQIIYAKSALRCCGPATASAVVSIIWIMAGCA